MTTWCIEIGSCDFDNIRPEASKHYLYVEPIPAYFESVRNKLLQHNCSFENSAITSFDGTMEMMYIEPETVSEQWVRGINHAVNTDATSNLINRNIELGYNIGTEKIITVNTLTLDSLLEKYHIDSIDVLKIDVEGHEIEIARNYSWRILPAYVKIEHKFVDVNELKSILLSKGYQTWHDKEDIYGILK